MSELKVNFTQIRVLKPGETLAQYGYDIFGDPVRQVRESMNAELLKRTADESRAEATRETIRHLSGPMGRILK